jgi:chromosome segregation ATPase
MSTTSIPNLKEQIISIQSSIYNV